MRDLERSGRLPDSENKDSLFTRSDGKRKNVQTQSLRSVQAPEVQKCNKRLQSAGSRQNPDVRAITFKLFTYNVYRVEIGMEFGLLMFLLSFRGRQRKS